MKQLFQALLFSSFCFSLVSCEVKCNIGSKEEVKQSTGTKPYVQDGTAIYNGIKLSADKVNVTKAYLVFDNGERVPDDNFIDFKGAVKLLLIIDSGWVIKNDKVFLSASEKVVAENGTILLNEEDLFAKYASDGISPEDAKIIGITVSLNLKEGDPPAYFNIHFDVRDKIGEGVIKGSYRLYTK